MKNSVLSEMAYEHAANLALELKRLEPNIELKLTWQNWAHVDTSQIGARFVHILSYKARSIIGVWFGQGWPNGPGLYCCSEYPAGASIFIPHDNPNYLDIIMDWLKEVKSHG